MATKVIGTGEVSRIRTLTGVAVSPQANIFGITFTERLIKDGKPISPETQGNWQFSVAEITDLVPEIQTVLSKVDLILENDTKEAVYTNQ